MTNEVPTLYNDAADIGRLNGLLDQITSKRFSDPAVAAQAIRAALDLHGITLPRMPVEGSPPTTADGHAAQLGVVDRANPDMYKAPREGEWSWKIKDANGPDGDSDDDLHLYIVMNVADENGFEGLIEVYAQVLDSEELEEVENMDDVTDKDYEALVGDIAGETDYLEKQRHISRSMGDS